MTNLVIQVPDDLAELLTRRAAAQHKTVQELAEEGLRALVEPLVTPPIGSPAAVLAAIRRGPRLSAEDVTELEAAISAGCLPVWYGDPFAE